MTFSPPPAVEAAARPRRSGEVGPLTGARIYLLVPSVRLSSRVIDLGGNVVPHPRDATHALYGGSHPPVCDLATLVVGCQAHDVPIVDRAWLARMRNLGSREGWVQHWSEVDVAGYAPPFVAEIDLAGAASAAPAIAERAEAGRLARETDQAVARGAAAGAEAERERREGLLRRAVARRRNSSGSASCPPSPALGTIPESLETAKSAREHSGDRIDMIEEQRRELSALEGAHRRSAPHRTAHPNPTPPIQRRGGPERREEGGGGTIVSLLLEQPEQRPAIRPANGRARPSTYGDLLRLVTGPGRPPIAGSGPSSRPVVVYLLDEGPLSATVFLCVATHARAAPLNPAAPAREIEDALLQLRPALVLTTPDREGAVGAILEGLAGRSPHGRRFAVPDLAITVPREDGYAGEFAYRMGRPNRRSRRSSSASVASFASFRSSSSSMGSFRSSSSPASSPSKPPTQFTIRSDFDDGSLLSTGSMPPPQQLRPRYDRADSGITIDDTTGEEGGGPDSVALLLRTSGTTSLPKIVPLTLGSIVRNATILATELGLTPSDVALNAMPLFHIGGLSASILAPLATGGSVVCLPSFRPETFCDALVAGPVPSRPTWYSSVPTIHLAVMRHASTFRRMIPHSLRLIRSGAADLGHSNALEMRRVWGGIPVVPSYSMTECMPIAQCPPDYELGKPGTVGRPLTSLRIIRHEEPGGGFREAPVGVAGEICIAGPNVMAGYAGSGRAAREANESAFAALAPDGRRFFRTGDLGYLDSDGYLYLTGRAKELIKVSGEQVSPYEVEAVLGRHRDVHLSLAYGIPDEIRGEVTGAVVVLRKGSRRRKDDMTRELRELCISEGLSGVKIPRFAFVDSEDDLPRGPTRKYLRKSLAAKFNPPKTAYTGTDLEEGRALLPGSSTSKEVGGREGGAPMLSDATSGIRFVLSIIVCLNHIGDHAWPHEGTEKSDHTPFSAAVTSMRVIGDSGVVLFGMLAGLSLVVSTRGAPVENKLRFYESRLVPIHLLYLVACALCVINRFASCQPGDFGPYVFGSTEACRATFFGLGYWETWGISLAAMLLCLQAWPIGVFVWHISYYSWFSSAYQACIFSYPAIQRLLGDKASRGRRVLYTTHFLLQLVHFLTLVLMEAVYLTQKAAGRIEFVNYWVWGGYMFPPFWIIRFACGCFLGFQFLVSRPGQLPGAWKWGVATDAMTIMIIAGYVGMIYFGIDIEYRFSQTSYLEDRMYCGVTPRLLVPFFMLYMYGLAVGRGVTCRMLSWRPLVSLSPASYAIYLFHQPVFEWWSYFIDGEIWTQRKPFEWFSPDPIILGWAETFVVITLTALFAVGMTHLLDHRLMSGWLRFVRAITCRGGRRKGKEGPVRGGESGTSEAETQVLDAIEDLVGLRPDLDDRPSELMASLGVVALIGALAGRSGASSTGASAAALLTPTELMECESVADLISVVDAKRAEAVAKADAEALVDERDAASGRSWPLRLWRGVASYYVAGPEDLPTSLLPRRGRRRSRDVSVRTASDPGERYVEEEAFEDEYSHALAA